MSKFNEVLLKEDAYIKTYIAPSFILELTEAHLQDIAEAQLPKIIIGYVEDKHIMYDFCDCGDYITDFTGICGRCGRDKSNQRRV
jgi:hypothetical protein